KYILLSWFCDEFFFSSRRRHTRFSRDWTSDVCSSDLVHQLGPHPVGEFPQPARAHVVGGELGSQIAHPFLGGSGVGGDQLHDIEIGRASCRDRVWSYA